MTMTGLSSTSTRRGGLLGEFGQDIGGDLAIGIVDRREPPAELEAAAMPLRSDQRIAPGREQVLGACAGGAPDDEGE